MIAIRHFDPSFEKTEPTEPTRGHRGNTRLARADSETMTEAKVHGGLRCSGSTKQTPEQEARRTMADNTPRATADESDGSTSVISHADWAGCRTIADLAELNVRFCESQAPESRSPGHFGPLNAESDLIREDLIRLNRRGWLTTNSQPTIETDTPGHQRSYLCAFIPTEDLERLMPGVVGRFNYTIADAGTGEVIYRVWDGVVDTFGNPQSPNGTCAHWGNETADDAFGWVPDDLVAQIETYYRAVSFSELGTGSPRELWDFLLAAADAD